MGRIFFSEGNHDLFSRSNGQLHPDIIRGEGEESAAAIDQHRELHLGRAPVIEELVKRGVDGPPRKKHVVDEEDRGAIDVGRDMRWREFFRDGVSADVIPMEGNVERPRPSL